LIDPRAGGGGVDQKGDTRRAGPKVPRTGL